MDSSKRNWPSMFRSKPSINSHRHQWQHDIAPLISRPSYTSSVSDQERTHEPKPRWNPKPEQIKILEGIFNSGMVNPPRDEIRRIRAQLQEYGQVGDANVFYWFQNRKSRSKNKKNNLQNSTTTTKSLLTSPPVLPKPAAPLSYSSSSSSDKSSADRKAFSCNVFDGLNSPTCSVNQPYFRTSTEQFLPEPYFFPASQSTTLIGGTTTSGLTLTQGFCFPELVASNDYAADHNNLGQGFGNCSTSVLLTDLMNLGGMNNNNNNYYKKVEDNDKSKMQQLLSYSVSTANPTCAQTILPPTVSPSVMSAINHIQGEELRKSTVFINEVAIEVASGPFNVREAFGDDAVLIHSSGQPVVTNEWGVTLHSLQHGAFYYLLSTAITTKSSHLHAHDLEI
ncbi:Homeobox domain-containing protein [Heracleum sosnowskyi]|uniref:Protein WUSCHEL n=1 Tax=Heracleum sosnowskyi TaxID=360622 RepID=A0AAD8MAW9_9APIA|nr:Homeobox domain-containing protein [Heracleum sosnowskyi]